MRIVLVNHSHPDTAHVSATRMREFARALAARSHDVALLTQPRRAGEAVPSAADIADMLSAGAQPSPMLVATPPKRNRVLNSLRAGYWPWGLRQWLIAYHYLRHGGLHSDWRAGARAYAEVLADRFKPDIVWATFGNTDSWAIAQDIARRARCPWIADIKDFWSSFIPGPLRRRLAARFGDAAALTAFSITHARDARPWFGDDIGVVYSGFDAETIRRDKGEDAQGRLVLTLTGSVYGGASLKPLLSAVAAWARTKPEDIRKRLLFIYRGNDPYEVGAALARAKLPFEAKAGGFVPLDDLQALHRLAFANLYVTSARTFHHKTIELLAARRPILAYPGDHLEAADLAERAHGTFHDCRTAAHVAQSLDAALADYESADAPVSDGLLELSWAAQADELEKIFAAAIGRAR